MYRYLGQLHTVRHRGLKRRVLVCLMAVILALLNSSMTLTAVAARHQARTWQPGAVYLQVGSSCVGYSLAAWLDAAPQSVSNHPNGLQIYERARELDGISTPHDGTTMKAGIEVLAQVCMVTKWESTQDADKALDFLRTQGPVILDSDFPQERPVLDSEDNLVWTGKMARHAWLCYGVDGQDRLTCQNSGSTSWNGAEGGRFHMSRTELVSVLAHGLAWLITKAPGVGY